MIMMKNGYCNLAQPLQQHPCRFAQGSGCKPSPSPKHDRFRPQDPKAQNYSINYGPTLSLLNRTHMTCSRSLIEMNRRRHPPIQLRLIRFNGHSSFELPFCQARLRNDTSKAVRNPVHPDPLRARHTAIV